MGAFCSRTLMPYDAEDLSVKLTAEDFDLKKGVEVAPEQRFEKPQFNDLWAAVLFVVHLGVTLLYGAGGFYFAMSDSDPTYTPDTYWESDYITIDLSDAFLCGVLLVVALSIGIVAAVVFYIVALKKPLVLIYFSYLTYFLMSMTMSVVILVTGIMVWSILLIILGSLFMAFSLLFCVCLFHCSQDCRYYCGLFENLCGYSGSFPCHVGGSFGLYGALSDLFWVLDECICVLYFL